MTHVLDHCTIFSHSKSNGVASMENKPLAIIRVLPTLIQNTHLDVAIEGWPAAAAIVAVCSAAVAIVSILKPADR